jgi:hypothetical protein
MSDALDVLYDAGGSTEPDPRFRALLLARVRAALAEPEASLPPHRDEAPGAWPPGWPRSCT